MSNHEQKPVIEFDHVTLLLGSKVILQNISLQVARGKTTVLIGPSGAGKTTLIKLAIGLVKPNSGRVLALGQRVHDLSHRALLGLRHRFGMLFQDGALFNNLTVFNNVAFPLLHHLNLKGAALKSRVEELLSLVDLQGFEDRMPDSLSGGQKKRVGLARALAMNPEVVLFDEPTSGLDPITTSNINSLIKNLQSQLGTTFLVITHDMKSAFAIADYVGLLQGGELIKYGPVKEVLSSQDVHIQHFLQHGLQTA